MQLRRSPFEIIFCSGYSIATGNPHADPLFAGRTAVAFFAMFLMADAYAIFLKDSHIESLFISAWPIKEQVEGRLGALGPDRALRFLLTVFTFPIAYLAYRQTRARHLFATWDISELRTVRKWVLVIFMLMPAPYLLSTTDQQPFAILAIHAALFLLVWLVGNARK